MLQVQIIKSNEGQEFIDGVFVSQKHCGLIHCLIKHFCVTVGL